MDDAVKSKRHWFCPTPGYLVIGLLAVEGLLLLSEQFCWLSFNQHKGWTVLIAAAAVGLTLLLMLLWLAAALLFRWRFQYSIRSLLLFVVAVAIPCSWLATEMQKARRQREVAEAIAKLDGSVTYDFEPKNALAGKPEPPRPAWLRRLLGVDFFAGIAGVNLVESKVTDGGLAHLERLSQLRSLTLVSTQVTDAGMVHLQGLSQLQGLWLENTRITDAGLEYISGLTQLQTLWLDSTRVTDAGLAYL